MPLAKVDGIWHQRAANAAMAIAILGVVKLPQTAREIAAAFRQLSNLPSLFIHWKKSQTKLLALFCLKAINKQQ
jgi:hypothetical protein